MKLLVVSYKECWVASSGIGHVTVGGFPHQIAALSELFAETRVMIVVRDGKPPDGVTPLEGHHLTVDSLPEPSGHGTARKLALLFWLPKHLGRMWRAIRKADAVHALVPGDIGTLGLLLALAQRKPLWVRHCGTWGNRQTIADRFLAWLLPRIAGGRNVVTATGGGESPPSPGTAVRWIFSTALKKNQISELKPAVPWRSGQPLQLTQVGRLTAGKNATATIRAMPKIRQHLPDARLDIAGDGPLREELKHLIAELNLDSCVRLTGNLPQGQVLRLLERSHLFIFPTRVAEGFPKAVLEAMACGVPILVPSVSVLPHLVTEGAGLLLDGTDPAAIMEGVRDLTEDPNRLATMAIQARKLAERYTLESWLELIHQKLEDAWGPFPTSHKAYASTSPEPEK